MLNLLQETICSWLLQQYPDIIQLTKIESDDLIALGDQHLFYDCRLDHLLLYNLCGNTIALYYANPRILELIEPARRQLIDHPQLQDY